MYCAQNTSQNQGHWFVSKKCHLWVKFVKKTGEIICYTYLLDETSIENIVIFGVQKEQKSQKCSMGLFDASKDLHWKDNFKNMLHLSTELLEV